MLHWYPLQVMLKLLNVKSLLISDIDGFWWYFGFGALAFLIKYNTSWSLIPHSFTPLEETTSGLFVIIWSMMVLVVLVVLVGSFMS